MCVGTVGGGGGVIIIFILLLLQKSILYRHWKLGHKPICWSSPPPFQFASDVNECINIKFFFLEMFASLFKQNKCVLAFFKIRRNAN